MKTLLKIQASLLGEQGQSSQLADRFISQWLAAHPAGRVVVRDLSTNPLPHLTSERFQAFNTKPQDRAPAQQAIVDESDELIAELNDADIIVFAIPMYNFSVPSTVRAYFDHIARSGVTFRYTEKGPEGLIKGKKTYVFVTRGGVYPESADTQTPYLRQFLSFIGLNDLTFVHVEGLDMGKEPRERALALAHARIAEAHSALDCGGLSSFDEERSRSSISMSFAIMKSGRWALALGSGLWAVGSGAGLWALGSGLWALGSGQKFPFVLAIELDSISFIELGDARREIDVVRDQERPGPLHGR